jgi:hypothetical protein
VFAFDIINDPRSKVVFEGAFDDLMKYVGQHHFVDLGTRKVVFKRLQNTSRSDGAGVAIFPMVTYYYVIVDPVEIP